MKARQLIGSASFGPDVLKFLFKAFDDAWEKMAPSYGGDPRVVEEARTKLAATILALAKARTTLDPGELKDSALNILGHADAC